MLGVLRLTIFTLSTSLSLNLWGVNKRLIKINDIKGLYNSKMYAKVIHHSPKVTGQLNIREKFALNYMLAQSYMKLNFYLLAIHKFKSLLKKASYQYEILNNIGACHYGLRQYQLALAYFSSSIDENPNYFTAIKNYQLVKRYISHRKKLPNIKETDAYADIAAK